MQKTLTPMKEEKREQLSQRPSPGLRSAEARPANSPAPASEGHDEMLTKKELAARLKVSVRTVEQWQHDGHLPYLRISGVLLFHWPAVVTALTEKFQICRRGVVTPMAEAKANAES